MSTRRRTRPLLSAAILFSVSFPMLAWCEEFVINVPVDVQDMDPIVYQVIEVSCYVQAAESGDGERIGVGRATQSMPEGGTFSGVVRVPIDVLPGKDPSRARGFVCSLMSPDGLTMEVERDRGTPEAQVKPGTSPVLQIRGALPRWDPR